MLSKRDLANIDLWENVGLGDMNVMYESDGHKAERRERAYRHIMAIINKKGSKALKKHEAGDNAKICNPLYADKILKEDAHRYYTNHRVHLLKRHIAQRKPRAVKFCWEYFVGDLYLHIDNQEKANKMGTHDFFYYEQQGGPHAEIDLKYIHAIEHHEAFPSPFKLEANDWDKIRDIADYTNAEWLFHNPYQRKEAVKRIDDLMAARVQNLY